MPTSIGLFEDAPIIDLPRLAPEAMPVISFFVPVEASPHAGGALKGDWGPEGPPFYQLACSQHSLRQLLIDMHLIAQEGAHAIEASS